MTQEENKSFELKGVLKEVKKDVGIASAHGDLCVIILGNDGDLYLTFKTVQEDEVRERLYYLLNSMTGEKIKVDLVKHGKGVGEEQYYRAVSPYYFPEKNSI